MVCSILASISGLTSLLHCCSFAQTRDITNLPVSQLPLQVQAWDAIRKAREKNWPVPEFDWVLVSPAKKAITYHLITMVEG